MNIAMRLLKLMLVFMVLIKPALAREPVAIIDHIDIPVVTITGKPVTTDQVKNAITNAAVSLNWQLNKSPNQDLLSATLHVRGKHTVVVSIPYSHEKFSLKYESSVNMKFIPGEAGGALISGNVNRVSQDTATGPRIHPFYNRWVQDLMQAIKLELNKL